jgi:tetratricopeptide (TPR) repeat protein
MSKQKKKVTPAKPALYPYILLPLLALLIYSNTFKNNYTLDDDIFIVHNAAVQKGLKGASEIFSHGSTYTFNRQGGSQPYRPITMLSFMLEKEMGIIKAPARHVINVLLYMLTSIFLYRLLLLMLGRNKYALAFFSCLLFIVHPLHTEVVASIKSRDEILCFLFAVLSLTHLLLHNESKKIKNVLLGVLFFLLCLLSKENGVTIIAIIPLTVFFFTTSSAKKILIEWLPYLGVIAAYFLLRNITLVGESDGSEKMIINNALNAAHNLSERYGTTFLMLGKYLLLLVFPYPLSYDYSFNQIPIAGFASPLVLFSLILHIALFAFAVKRFKQKDILSYCILFYFITLSVTSNLFFISGSTLAERFLYMPSFGFCIASSILIFRFTKIDSDALISKMKPVSFYIFIPAAIIFSALTINRNGDWKDNFSLYLSGVNAAPNSARAHSSLAYEYKLKALKEPNPVKREDFFLKGISEFKKSTEILPDFEHPLYNLGVLYYEKGDTANSLAQYLQTLKYFPRHVNACNNIGVIYFNRHQPDSALFYFEKALAADSNNIGALGNIGAIYQNKGEFQKAIDYYERTIAIDPFANVYRNLSNSYNQLGDSNKAQFYEEKSRTMSR